MPRMTAERLAVVRNRLRAFVASGIRTIDVEGLLADRDELKAEVEKWQADGQHWRDCYDESCKQRAALAAEVARLRATNDALAGACREARHDLRYWRDVAQQVGSDRRARDYEYLIVALSAALAAHAEAEGGTRR